MSTTASPSNAPTLPNESSNGNVTDISASDIPIGYYFVVLGSLMLCCLVMVLMFYWYHHRNLLKLINHNSKHKSQQYDIRGDTTRTSSVQIKLPGPVSSISPVSSADDNNYNNNNSEESISSDNEDNNNENKLRKETFNTMTTMDDTEYNMTESAFSPDGNPVGFTIDPNEIDTPWALIAAQNSALRQKFNPTNTAPLPHPPHRMKITNNIQDIQQQNLQNLQYSQHMVVGSIPKPAFQQSAMPMSMGQIPYNSQFGAPLPSNEQLPIVYNDRLLRTKSLRSRSATVKTGPIGDVPPSDVNTMLSDISTSSDEDHFNITNVKKNTLDIVDDEDDILNDSVSTKMRKKKNKNKKSTKKTKKKNPFRAKKFPDAPIKAKRKKTEETMNTETTDLTIRNQQTFVEPKIAPTTLSEVSTSGEDDEEESISSREQQPQEIYQHDKEHVNINIIPGQISH